MALAPAVVKLVQDLEAALEAVISSEAVPALEAELNSVIPAGEQAIALAMEAATLSEAQAAVASLLAKIPAVS